MLCPICGKLVTGSQGCLCCGSKVKNRKPKSAAEIARETAAYEKQLAEQAAQAAAAEAQRLEEARRLEEERQAELARIEAERKAEQERIAAEKARLAAERKAEQERLAAERKAERARRKAERKAKRKARKERWLANCEKHARRNSWFVFMCDIIIIALFATVVMSVVMKLMGDASSGAPDTDAILNEMRPMAIILGLISLAFGIWRYYLTWQTLHTKRRWIRKVCFVLFGLVMLFFVGYDFIFIFALKALMGGY